MQRFSFSESGRINTVWCKASRRLRIMSVAYRKFSRHSFWIRTNPAVQERFLCPAPICMHPNVGRRPSHPKESKCAPKSKLSWKLLLLLSIFRFLAPGSPVFENIRKTDFDGSKNYTHISAHEHRDLYYYISVKFHDEIRYGVIRKKKKDKKKWSGKKRWNLI